MQAVRQERMRGRAATSAAASKLLGSAMPASVPSAPPKAAAFHVYSGRKYAHPTSRMPASSDRIGSSSGRRPQASSRTHQASEGGIPCARAAQEGFSFGGQRPNAGQSRTGSRPSMPERQEEDHSNPHRAMKESVRAQLTSIKYKSEADQKAVVKKLLVKWHPDRNPESTEMATAMFQYIQQEKEQMLGL
eukprot:gb/GFBE01005967.1/.p1 GENE.gb/GFBE01005967.1/~~gb/GFBE01005967.1/.p1  ORF type:complete len:190 (+),score=23.45 gb/GFBE01005967.1/:1-570(+)